jgi:hypothetical protein
MARLIASQRIILGLMLIVIGAGLITTVIGAVIGIPMVLLGIWLALQKSSTE